jgi:hypothetical protein
MTLWLHIWDHETGGQPVQQYANGGKIFDVPYREFRYRNSLMGTLNDEFFTLQLQQGFTNRHTADPVI